MAVTGSGPLLRKPLGKITDPKVVRLKDGTVATIYPVYSPDELPDSLVKFLHVQFNEEIERGQTYPYYHQQSEQEFRESWFVAFVAVMIRGEVQDLKGKSEADWEKEFLGTYYIKPNYVGRCSHVCNAGFIVNPNSRGKSVGKTLGQSYLKWAPVLGYTYSVFNLVFVTNVASVRIWDGLGFDRIGLVPGVGELKGHPEPVDAVIFGKKL